MTNALRLDGWEVQDFKQTDDGKVAEARYLPQTNHCPKCGVIRRCPMWRFHGHLFDDEFSVLVANLVIWMAQPWICPQPS